MSSVFNYDTEASAPLLENIP